MSERHHESDADSDVNRLLSELEATRPHLRSVAARVREALNSTVEPTSTPHERKRVLVVDDVEDVRALLGMLLRSEGFEVDSATNGVEALIAAHAFRPDVILMDLSMPVLDGMEATRLLKVGSATRSIPVIAHTAMTPPDPDSPDRPRFAHVVSKPIVPGVLVALIRRFAETLDEEAGDGATSLRTAPKPT